MNILLVEDDHTLTSLFGEGMRTRGNHVEISNTGEDALWRIRERAYDLVLLDIFLPDMEGCDLIPLFREVRPDMRIIAMTGHNSRELEARVRRQGVLFYMIKPFELNHLWGILDHIQHRVAQDACQ